MTNNIQNPVAGNGTGADSQNQVTGKWYSIFESLMTNVSIDDERVELRWHKSLFLKGDEELVSYFKEIGYTSEAFSDRDDVTFEIKCLEPDGNERSLFFSDLPW